MANTFVDYNVSTSTTNFDITFEYLQDSHIVVEIDGVVQATSAYSIVTGSPPQVQMNSAVTSGAVRIRRDSDANSDAPYVDFVNGSVLTETDLDKAYRHNLYLNEEIGNLNEQSLQKKVGDDTKWDAQSQPIVNITDPNLVQSAATKNYVDTQISNQITGSSTESSVYSFTGNGSSTAFTFSPAISLGSDTMYEVAIDGVLQTPTTAYAIDADANTITFTSAPPSSASIVVVQRGYAVPVATGSSYTHPNHTGDVTSAGDGATTIADNAVTSSKIIDNAVITAKVADNAVTTSKVSDNNISTNKLADNAVTSAKIAADAVTSSEIANNAVTTNKIADANVTATKVGFPTAIAHARFFGSVGTGTLDQEIASNTVTWVYGFSAIISTATTGLYTLTFSSARASGDSYTVVLGREFTSPSSDFVVVKNRTANSFDLHCSHTTSLSTVGLNVVVIG